MCHRPTNELDFRQLPLTTSRTIDRRSMSVQMAERCSRPVGTTRMRLEVGRGLKLVFLLSWHGSRDGDLDIDEL